MPGFPGKFGAQPVRERFQSGRKHGFDVCRRQHANHLALLMPVYSCAESLRWNKCIDWMTGRDGDGNRALSTLILLSHTGGRDPALAHEEYENKCAEE